MAHDSSDTASRVRINCGGRLFETTLETLVPSFASSSSASSFSLDSPDLLEPPGTSSTFFAALVRSRNAVKQAEPTAPLEIFLDRDPDTFAVILTFMRTGELRLRSGGPSPAEVATEAEFFNITIPQLAATRRLKLQNAQELHSHRSLYGVSMVGLNASAGSSGRSPREDGIYWSERGNWFLWFGASGEGFDSGAGKHGETFTWSHQSHSSCVLSIEFESYDDVTYAAGGVKQRHDLSVPKRRRRSVLWDGGRLIDDHGDTLAFLAAAGSVLQGVSFFPDGSVTQPIFELSAHESIFQLRFPLTPTEPFATVGSHDSQVTTSTIANSTQKRASNRSLPLNLSAAFPASNLSPCSSQEQGDTTSIDLAVLFQSEQICNWAVYQASPVTVFDGVPGLVVKRFFIASDLVLIPLGGYLLVRLRSNARSTRWHIFTIDPDS